MKTIWLVLNIASGSTTAAVIAEFDAACSGYEIVGRTDFPAQPLPDAAALDAAAADTLVVFGGDGTINAATAAVDDWGGTALVLPGGTMNGLSKALHGAVAWRTILDRAHGAPAAPVPVARCGPRRALVGVILGPAASWCHAREAVRHGTWGKIGRALRLAVRITFARSIRVVGSGPTAGRHRAVIVTPQPGGLEIAAISTRSWLAAARLGVDWLTGNWRHGADVAVDHAATVTCSQPRAITALFDGEVTKLASPATVEQALTRLRFVATRDAAP